MENLTIQRERSVHTSRERKTKIKIKQKKLT